jgi:polyhydroxyalkanoate synthesis regulator phasin
MPDDINYGELFGLDESENTQEAAEPAQDEAESTQGENEQEVAEPAGDDTESSAEPDDVEPEKQTPEQNAKYAAARRKAEQERDQAVAQAKSDAKAEADKYLDETIAGMGLTNPYTKQPITTKAEYDEYKAKYEEEKRNRVVKKSGMSQDEFRKFVDDLPEVKQAKAIAAQAQEQQAKMKIDEQLRQITEMDPSIKELGDLTKMDNYDEFYGKVKRGMTLVEAYMLTNFDKLSGRKAAATKQAALNSINSKQHLSGTSSRGTGALSVPADVKDMYRAINPDATDAEIQAHYNKYHRKD